MLPRKPKGKFRVRKEMKNYFTEHWKVVTKKEREVGQELSQVLKVQMDQICVEGILKGASQKMGHSQL